MALLLMAVGICLLQTVASMNGPIATDKFSYHEQLDPNYNMWWNFNSTHIVFKLQVKTTGYVGFGISLHGDMFPADIIIGWVKDGHVHMQDRHGTGHVMPVVDSHQDWTVISGSEDHQHTTIIVIRKLNTCDQPDDLPITEGTTRVIFSYNSYDPVSDDHIPYHGMSRGGKSIMLLDPPATELVHDILPSDLITIDFLNNNYSVPSAPTMYSCIAHKLPVLTGKHHLIRVEPIIQKGHEHLVHHIVVYACTHSLHDSNLNKNVNCYHHYNPELNGCWFVFVAWAIGGTAFDYPAHVGHSLGTSEDPVYFRMETHFDNVNMRSDFVDNSGLRLVLTKQLRQHDAGMMQIGAVVDRNQIIPPHYDNFLSRNYCHENCIAEVLGDEEINIFSGFLHSHLIGKAITARLVTNGVEQEPLLQDLHYDFNYQEQRALNRERVVKKGDTIIVDCVYDSTKRPNITYGGLDSTDEMCLAFMLYYPRKPLSTCSSRIEYKIPSQFAGQNVKNIVDHLDFSKKNIRDGFVDDIEQSNIRNYCHATVQTTFNYIITPHPKITTPYVPVDVCTGQ